MTTTDQTTPDVDNYQPKIGDHFYASWGYDQTNVDFYEVVGVTASGKSVRVVEVGQRTTDDTGSTTHVVPVVGFPRGAVMTKRLRWWRGAPSFYLTSYSNAYFWDGTPKYQTGQGWGH